MIDPGELKTLIQDKVDKRFEDLASRRTNIERKWADKIIAATDGTAPSPHKNTLIKLYTNLGDMTLPSLCRKLHARETAWLDQSFLRWTPDGVESTDVQGTYWISDYQQDNLNNELSNFHNTIRACIWQREIINLACMNYKWVIIPRVKYNYDMDMSPDGMMQLSGGQAEQVPFEYDLQGLQFEFVSMFNIYPDVIGVTTYENLNALDLYSKSYRTYKEIKEDPIYNGASQYVFKPNVLYSSTQGLDEVPHDQGVTYSAAQLQLNNYLHSSTSTDQSNKDKNLVELRTVIVKSIKLPDQPMPYDAEGRGLKIVYAKVNSTCVPLLIEKMPFQFEKKTLRLSRKWIDPTNLYNDSEMGLAYNQHVYIVTNKQLQASAIAKATAPNKLWSDKLITAFSGTTDELRDLWTTSGSNKFINLAKLGNDPLNHLNPIKLGEDDEAIRSLQLFEQAIQQAKNDIQQINAQVTQESGAGATAAYNNQVSQELDLMSRESKASICRDWLRPSLEYGFELAKFAFHDQLLTTDIGEDEQNMLVDKAKKAYEEVQAEGDDEVQIAAEGINWELIKKLTAEKQATIAGSMRIGQDERTITYNPVTGKKQAVLSKALFQNTQGSLKLEFEEQEYSKANLLAETVQMFGQIVANIPDSPLKYIIIKKAADRVLQLTKDPEYKEISEEMQKALDAMLNPPPPAPEQMAQQEAQTQAVQAKANKDNAQAQHMQANAAKTGQEVQANQAAMQLAGVG